LLPASPILDSKGDSGEFLNVDTVIVVSPVTLLDIQELWRRSHFQFGLSAPRLHNNNALFVYSNNADQLMILVVLSADLSLWITRNNRRSVVLDVLDPLALRSLTAVLLLANMAC
jgi:hypothetical protein